MIQPAVTPFPPPPTPIERIISPFGRFVRTESSGGIVLLAATVVALLWANSPWAESYFHLWETPVTLGWGAEPFRMSLHHFINDGLMVMFFFLVGLEIKREVLVGELASPRRAALPIAAALGGMLIPALIYVAVNVGGEGLRGWGIPMATDIAFALGVLALMGPQVPTSLKVFLAAVAIVDDLGAVLVIALFYTANINLTALLLAFLFLAVLVGFNRLGVRHPGAYLAVGVIIWLLFLRSGVHATVAGVLSALAIPARTRIDSLEFMRHARYLLDRFEAAGEDGHNILTNPGQQGAIVRLESACEYVQAPLQRIEHDLQRWIAFGVVPLFALANAGVRLQGGELTTALGSSVTLGVLLGLVFGKPLGVMLFSWLAVRLGLAAPPQGVSWRALHGVAWLTGIGFTMSLFIGNLAFGEGLLLDEAKIGVLAASIAAGLAGWMLLRGAGVTAAEPAPADEPVHAAV